MASTIQVPQEVPVIDVSLLHQEEDSHKKSIVVEQIREACKLWGAFHVINHGISESVIQEALEVNRNFFELPEMMKKEFSGTTSDDMFIPVKLYNYQHSDMGSKKRPKELFKLYANPIEDFIDFWPTNPADYREKMGRYAKDMRGLSTTLFEAIMESLNLGHTHLQENFERGTHVSIVNRYVQPPPESSIKIVASPHTDPTIITILLQGSPGLEIQDMADSTWKALPSPKGSLVVLVGDHLEVLSNGRYKSVFHRVSNPSCTLGGTRISIASNHNFELDEVVEPDSRLTGEDCPKRYRGCSKRDLHEYAFNTIGQVGRLIDRLKI